MKKWTIFLILVVILLTPIACTPVGVNESENPFLEEELAEAAIATAQAKKTQTVTKDLSYAEISNGEKTYLAFGFTWNDETVFLPLAESQTNDTSVISCQLDSETGIVIGKLYSGFELSQNECPLDEQALKNALPTIVIPRYFEDGIGTERLNIIDLQGKYAQNFADVATFIIKNDLQGSGDLTISLHRTDGPNGEPCDNGSVSPTYTLPAQALQITFSNDQLKNFEYADDAVYALARAFTWKIPDGYSSLNLSPGDENWFVLDINESGREPVKAFIQIKSVGSSETP